MTSEPTTPTEALATALCRVFGYDAPSDTATDEAAAILAALPDDTHLFTPDSLATALQETLFPVVEPFDSEHFAAAILAIEREAAAAERERLRKAIAGLPSPVFLPHDIERIYAGDSLPLVTRHAVNDLVAAKEANADAPTSPLPHVEHVGPHEDFPAKEEAERE